MFEKVGRNLRLRKHRFVNFRKRGENKKVLPRTGSTGSFLMVSPFLLSSTHRKTTLCPATPTAR